MPLQFRRGTDSDRLTITPVVGEPVFTTDTKKIFVGDGATVGGIEVTGTDSAAVTGLIDSAYIQARQADIFRDSAFITNIVDSAYVQALQVDLQRDSAFINNLINEADTHDSAAVQGQITSTVNATYINALTIDADTVGGLTTGYLLDYTNHTNTPTIPAFGTDYVDSAAVSTIITTDVDAAFINNLVNILDSTNVSSIITNDVDVGFVNALNVNAATLNSQNASYYLDYANFTGTPTIPTLGTDFVDSSEVNTLIDTRVDKTFVDALNVDADTLDGQNGTYYLDYNNFSNTPTLPVLGTDFVDSVEARKLVSVTDAGGDGSLAYNNSTGVFTYTGPSAAEVQAHITGGTGVTITSGQIDIGQSVETTDNVTFADINAATLTLTGDLVADDITANNLTINGSTTTVNSITYTVVDPLLHLADSNEQSDAVDIGFVGHYSPDGGTTKEHTGFFRDATNSEFYIFNGLQDAAFDSTLPTNVVDRSGTGFTLATLNVGTLVGDYAGFDSDFSLKTTSDLTEGSRLYYTDARANSAIDARVTKSFVDALNVDADTLDGQNGTYYLDYNNFSNTPTIPTFGTDYVDSAAVSTIITTDVNNAFIRAVIDDSTLTIDGDGSTGGVTIADGGITIRTGTGNVAYADFYCETSNAHRTRLKSAAHGSYSGNVDVTLPTSTGTLALTTDITTTIDSAYINARTTAGTDSAATIALITATVDSAYVALREADAGGGSGTVDSAATIALITATVDSAYVALREADAGGGGGGSGTVDSAQTISLITSTVDSSYVNGLVDGRVGAQDIIAPFAFGVVTSTSNASGTGISWSNWNAGSSTFDFTFTTAQPDADYFILTDNDFADDLNASISSKTTTGFTASFYDDTGSNIAPNSSRPYGFIVYGSTPTVSTGGGAAAFNINKFNYTATAGQTTFTGADNTGDTLSYSSGMIMAHLNGFLLKETIDYTANNSTSLVLNTAADSGNELTITSFSGGKVYPGGINTFSFVADSGQTAFTGADANGTTLDYSAGNTQVFLNGILLDDADFTATDGSTITLASAADSADYLNIASYHMLQSSVWNTTSTNINASGGDKLFVDVSSGIVTVTLPSAPSMGDEVRIIDGEGNAATNNITVARNGNKIQAGDSDFVIDFDRAGVGFVYYNANNGWVLIEN